MTAKEAKIISDKNRMTQSSEQWDKIMNIIKIVSNCGDDNTLFHSFVYEENEQKLVNNGYMISWSESKKTAAK